MSIKWFILGFFSGFLLIGLGFILNSEFNKDLQRIEDSKATKQLDSLKTERFADSIRADHYRAEKERLFDTLMSYKVENGRLSIELNRKTEELLQANKRYAKQRQEQQVEKALSICDSIVYTYIPDYLAVDTTLRNSTDSLTNKYSGWVDYQAKVIDSSILRINNLSNGLETSIKDNATKEVSNKKQERKRLISWGVVGAAIGALIAVIFGK